MALLRELWVGATASKPPADQLATTLAINRKHLKDVVAKKLKEINSKLS